MSVSRRWFLGGAASVVASSAVGLPSVGIGTQAAIFYGRNNLLQLNIITREAIQLFKNSNAFLKHLDTEFATEFARPAPAKIGSTLRIRLPSGYVVHDDPISHLQRHMTLAMKNCVPAALSNLENSHGQNESSALAQGA